MDDQFCDVAVIGAGIAGLTVAAGLAAREFSVVLMESLGPGGHAANIQNGFDTYGLNPSGAELTAELLDKAIGYGAQLEFAEADSLQTPGGHDPLVVTTIDRKLHARAVVVATGTTVSVSDLPGADEYIGRGVSTCAGCDGALFRGKHVVVVGGDDISQFEAAHLSTLASRTSIISPHSTLPLSAATSTLTGHHAVHLLLGRTVSRVVGEDGLVTGLVLDDGNFVQAEGVFAYGRYLPNTAWLSGCVTLDAAGFVPTDGLHTEVRGVFAVGDVRSQAQRRVMCAAGDGIAVVRDIVDQLSRE